MYQKTKPDVDADKQTKALRHVCQQLQSMPANDVEPLSGLVQDCLKTSTHLDEAISCVRQAGQNHIRAFFKSAPSRKKITKLESTLKGYQTVLDSAILTYIRQVLHNWSGL